MNFKIATPSDPAADQGLETILEVRNLRTRFHAGGQKTAFAVDGVSFTLNKGETLGIVGESGCGKSVTSLSIMRLLPQPPAQIEADSLCFAGEELLELPETAMRTLRGNRIAMIFQDPMTSLNPVLRIERQLTEGLVIHKGISQKAATQKAIEMLAMVRVPDPARIMRAYPHELSGGMRQRIMIAMAMLSDPEVLIADEPTTALDVTVQDQILVLMKELQQAFNTAVLFITHDLGVVAQACDRVLVMYGGRVVEEASVSKLFERSAHPYTAGLMRAVPRLEHAFQDGEPDPLSEIPGVVPPLTERMPGCRFAPRCSFATERCGEEQPQLETIAQDHRVACFVAKNILEASHD